MRTHNTLFNSYTRVQTSKSKFITYSVIALVSYVAGFSCSKNQNSDKNGVYIYDNKIHYENISRPIFVHSNRIVVGTLKERLFDLLHESPGVVKKKTEEILEEIK